MKYSIQIGYVNNIEKSARLTIEDSNSERILDNVPVAMPLDYYNKLKTSSIRLEIQDTKQKRDLLNDDEYEKLSNRFQLMGLDSVIKTNKEFLIIPNIPLGNNKEKLNSTKDAFVLHERDFLKLRQLINGKGLDLTGSFNTFEITIDKKLFLWNQETVNTSKNNISIKQAVNDLTEKEAKAIATNERKQHSKSGIYGVGKNSTNIDINKKLNSSIDTEYIKKTGSQLEQERVKLKDGKTKENQRKENLYNQEQERLRNEDYRRRNNNDLDALDIVLMYNNPSLSPLYRPDSILAWSLYFNEKDVNSQNVQNSITELKGFEDVNCCDVKYTTSGYSVKLYEDEQKEKLIGTLTHDSNNGSFSMKKPDGEEITSIMFNESGDAKGFVHGEKGDTNFELIKNSEGGFTGNWQSESSEGIKMSSGISLSEDLTSSSTPFQPVNLSTVIKEREENTIQYGTTKELELPPPPPPPPEPDTLNWSTSSDSYSNSSSFSP